jgi:hypothetical protein
MRQLPQISIWPNFKRAASTLEAAAKKEAHHFL